MPMKCKMREIPFERIIAITRDILSVQDLEPALESIAHAVQEIYKFKYVTIVAADASGEDMMRRVMLGWSDDIVAERKYERIVRSEIVKILDPACEIVENGFFIPAERELEWAKSIYAGEAPREAPREAPDRWHERDVLIFVLPDNKGDMLAYISADEPLDGKIPTLETLTSMQLFVNLIGLAVAHAYAHVAEVTRRRLLEASQARLRHEATHDTLTGLPNRSLFGERLVAKLAHARMHVDGVSAVLFVDLDEFKSINDSLGHVAGDVMLGKIAERMRTAVGPTDFVARLGGDEFAVLVDERVSRDDIELVVNDIAEAIARPMEIEEQTIYSTASIGIATIDPGVETIEAVLRNADTAMYFAKSNGRARHAFFSHDMHLKAARRLTLTSQLRAAVEREEFAVVYQPIVRLADECIVGFEALVRWNNPVTGEVMPNEFIPMAEDIGTIVAIGRFVFVESCRMLALWRGLSPERNLRMHLNLSAQEVLRPDLDAFVMENLARFGLRARDITLELTETAILRSGSAATQALERLQATGVAIAIDDFGTGYSSLRYLDQFPVATLKIDRSFVGSESGALGSLPIVRMMIQLAESFGLSVVAEGVETAAQANTLHELGCVHAQGYFFHRPLRPEAIRALLTEAVALSA